MTNTNNKPTGTRAFQRGLRQLRICDERAAKQEIRNILGVTTNQMLLNYAKGRTATLDVGKALAIQEVFKRYGVTDCWGL